MSDTPKVKYGDGEIRFREFDEKWEAFIKDERIGSRATLDGARKLIDKYGEDEKKFERHTALRKRYNDPWETVTVTSYPEGTSYRGQSRAWITKANKKREQADFDELREDNQKNQDILAGAKLLQGKIDALVEQRENLLETMDEYQRRTPMV